MPSREEIAGWLREAGNTLAALSMVYNSNIGTCTYSTQLHDRAEEVENMRCENCSKRESDFGICGDLEVFVHSKFGCFSWESKEANK